MKTVADFKRAIKLGTKLHCTFHQAFAGRDEQGNYLFMDEDRGVREVSICKSTQFALKTKQKRNNNLGYDRTEVHYVDVYNTFPKAGECIVEENKITYLQSDFRDREGKGKLIPLLTYTLI